MPPIPDGDLPLAEAARRLGWPPVRLAGHLGLRTDARVPWRRVAELIGHGFNRPMGCPHGACDEPRSGPEDWP